LVRGVPACDILFAEWEKLHACAPGFSFNQHDTGVINFGDPQFVKHLIENYG